MDDVRVLAERNLRFIEACRQGSVLMLEPILSRTFSYLDGATGEVWELDRYAKDLTDNPAPSLRIDDVAIHVDGDSAIVSARAQTRRDRRNRYLDTYTRARKVDGGAEWLCIHACVWPLPTT